MHGEYLAVSREKPFDILVLRIVIQVADVKFLGAVCGNTLWSEKSAEKVADAV